MKNSVKNIVQGSMCAVFLTQNLAGALAQQSVRIPNGQDAAQGALADAACLTAVSATCTIVSLTKSIVSAVLSNLNITGTVSAIGLAQGTALSGPTGSLIMGAVATGVSAYTSATIQSLTMGTTGNLNVAAGYDPCQFLPKTFTTLTISTTTVQRILAAVNSTTNLYVCQFFAYPGATSAINISTGSAGTCAVSSAALIGGLTSTTGLQLAPQAGFLMGGAGFTIMRTYTAGFEICLTASIATSTSGSSIAGNISYVNF